MDDFTRRFWSEKLTIADLPSVARIGGEHYIIGAENSNGFRGFGGQRFVIRFHDGREVVTTNLWSQGTIPESYRTALPDNAVFVFHKAFTPSK